MGNLALYLFFFLIESKGWHTTLGDPRTDKQIYRMLFLGTSEIRTRDLSILEPTPLPLLIGLSHAFETLLSLIGWSSELHTLLFTLNFSCSINQRLVFMLSNAHCHGSLTARMYYNLSVTATMYKKELC